MHWYYRECSIYVSELLLVIKDMLQIQVEMEAVQKQFNDRLAAIVKELLSLNTLKDELVEANQKLNNTCGALEVQRIVEDEIKKSGAVQDKI